MLRRIADGVFVHESAFCQSNTVVVDGPVGGSAVAGGTTGVLLIDPGVHETELSCLARDLSESSRTVVAGFSTHPHWDHLLWHAGLGDAPRYGTARCADTVRQRLAGGIDARRFGIPDEVSLDLLGSITALPAGATRIPWDGPEIRIIEHQAHAPGHAALVIADSGVLVAGDMLSDVLIPMLDVYGSADPVGDHLTALSLFEAEVEEVDALIPGHGSVAGAGEALTRIAQDRAYLTAVREGRHVEDPRIGTSAAPGWEWVTDVHTSQEARLAQKDGHDEPSGPT